MGIVYADAQVFRYSIISFKFVKTAMLKYIILFFFLNTFYACAQTNTIPKKGKKSWFSIQHQIGIRKHAAVLEELEQFVAKYPDFMPARRQLAESYLYVGEYNKASDFIQNTIELFPPTHQRWWAMSAEAYEKQKRYPEAIASLKKVESWPGLGIRYKALVSNRIKDLEFIHYMKSNPVPFFPESVGDQINTENHELYPFLTPEGTRLFFTRKERNEDLYFAEKVHRKWTNVQALSFNTNENEGAQTISADGRLILFTACNRPTGLGSCDIFYSIKHNDQWTEPAGIGAPINSTDWESQPYITGNGMSVIFSSNRPGGFGGKDLYISHLSKENKWLEPQNLGSTINTSGDEETPFLHADGKTLFFSSNGHPSIGGKDLYMSRLSDSGVWSEPVNLGYPINTEENESSIYISIDGKTAFMASDRVEGKGGLDIYEFELHEAVQAQTATYVKAIVKDAKTKQRLSVEYSVFEFENNSLFASGKTRQLGEFLITMPTDKTYRLEIGKKGYVFHSERFLAEEGSHLKPFILEVYLQPIEEGASIVLQNVLFKTDSHILEEASFPELQKVAELMHSDKNISAIIKGHTDDVGDAEYNLSLSQKRAQSVVEYLVGEGVAKERLTTQGYGESQPLKPNTSDENRQINRRTEFEIIKN